MATAQRTEGPEHEYRMERWRIKAAPHVAGMDRRDSRLLLEFLDALDPGNYNVQPGDIGSKEKDTWTYSSLEAYGQNLRLTALAADRPLADMTTAEVNDLFSSMDLKQNTVSQRQSAARVFYQYHDDLGVDAELITMESADRSPVQPRDLFTRDEVDAMHDVIGNSRDRALIDLMLYTGQRVRAIQTLRVGDMDLEDNRFYLNTDAAGLKGAKGMRPLTLAHDACASWMADHPASDDPDAYFITKLPGANRGDVHTPIQQSTIYRRVQQIAERAGIDRWKARGHPHNFRHTFVRWGYVNKDMDIPELKYMTGHAKDSRTLERTYMNIFESDFARKVEEKAGVKTAEEPDDELTPDVCPWCDYAPLPQDARACPRCTNLVDPDAALERQSLQAQAEQRIPEVETEAEARAVAAVLRELREDPGDALEGE